MNNNNNNNINALKGTTNKDCLFFFHREYIFKKT